MKSIFERMRARQPQFFSSADITIAAGQSSATFDVTVNGDANVTSKV